MAEPAVVVKKDEPIPSKNELLDADVGDGEVPELQELTPREQEAKASGWVTEEEWVESGKDAKTWRPAEAWLDRGVFFKQIGELKGELSQTRAQVAASFETGRKMAEAKFKEELTSLKAERRTAQEEQDFDKVDEIEDKMDKVKDQLKEAEPKKVTGAVTPPPEHNLFLTRNPWYNNNAVLHHAADGLGYEFRRVNPNATPADLYWFVEQQIRAQFPDATGSKPRVKSPEAPEANANATRGTSSGSRPSGSLSAIKSGMDDTERGIMKTLVKSGVFKNEEEYLKEYAGIPAGKRR